MPRGNGTGPMGMGPMTGRGVGFCAGFNMPGLAGNGVGFGGGRGRRNCFYATGLNGWQRDDIIQTTVTGNKESLQRQADALQARLEAVKKRLDKTESEN